MKTIDRRGLINVPGMEEKSTAGIVVGRPIARAFERPKAIESSRCRGGIVWATANVATAVAYLFLDY